MSKSAVILAGGLGERLKPFTEVIPKPLLPIGEGSILEVQIKCLKKHGFDTIFIATNYMSDYVEAFLGDGSKFGVTLTFSREADPLGTCGPLSLLRDRLTMPFVLMNGDILTNLDFSKAYNYALAMESNLVVMTKVINLPFHFGKVIAKGDYIDGVEEKVEMSHEILAGIYILKPPVLEMIPDRTYYGVDVLIRDMLKAGKQVGRYLIQDYWIDIGQAGDYEKARQDYSKHFKE